MKSFNQFQEDLDRLNARRQQSSEKSSSAIERNKQRIASHTQMRQDAADRQRDDDEIVSRVVKKLKDN
jgi:hypothetical protein